MSKLAQFNAYTVEEVETYSHAKGYKTVLFAVEEKLKSDKAFSDEFSEDQLKYIEGILGMIEIIKMEVHLPKE